MRCFTLLLACGWLLFRAPNFYKNPSDPASIYWDTSRPLSEWVYVKGFDVAKDCEAEKERGVDLVRRFSREGLKKAYGREPTKEEFADFEKQQPNWDALLQCVPSDALGFKFK